MPTDFLRFPGLKKLKIQGETKLIGFEEEVLHDAVRRIFSPAKIENKVQPQHLLQGGLSQIHDFHFVFCQHA